MFAKKTRSFAKINLSLNITGAKGGYHLIDSVAANIDIWDTVCAKPRSDGLINVYMHGLGSENIPPEKNNAVRAGEAFVAAFGTKGADIEIYKDIPIGAGLGGSSADAAGVLKALGMAYGAGEEAVSRLAESVGSDVKYMLRGGYAVLRGRGERVEYLESGVSLPLLALLSDYPVNTAECYRKCDELGLCPVNGTARAAESLQRGDIAALKANLFNGMTEAAKRLNGQIGGNLAALESAGGAALMSGSGGTTFAVFETEAERDKAYEKLRPAFGSTLLKCKTI